MRNKINGNRQIKISENIVNLVGVCFKGTLEIGMKQKKHIDCIHPFVWNAYECQLVTRCAKLIISSCKMDYR